MTEVIELLKNISNKIETDNKLICAKLENLENRINNLETKTLKNNTEETSI